MLFNKERAEKYLAQCGLDALIVTSPANITYVTDYYCWLDPIIKGYMIDPGTTSELALPGYAVFPSDGEPALVLFPLFAANAADSWVQDIRTFGQTGVDSSPAPGDLDDFQRRIYDLLLSSHSASSTTQALIEVLKDRKLSDARIGLEMEGLGSGALEELRAAMPNAQWLDCSNLLRLIRMVKSKSEIEILTRAAEISEKGLTKTLSQAHPGISLAELSSLYRLKLAENDADLDHFCIGLKGLGMVTEPEYQLERTDVLFVDCGCIYRHYFSDTGTTLAFEKLPDALRSRHEALHASVLAGMEAVRPGVTSSIVREAMSSELTGRGFSASNPHGHGLGLEVRDYPTIVDANDKRIQDGCVDVSSDLPLEADMAINLEAPMFMAGIGSMQVEHSFVVTDEGCRYLIQQDRKLFLSGS